MNNIDRLKKVQTIAKQLKAKNKKLSHLEAVKQAWKKIGSVIKHKDTKSHNVNIKVVSGIKKTVKKTVRKKVGALPVGLTGSFFGWKFKVLNQFTIDGGVTAQIIEIKTGKLITELNGRIEDVKNSTKEIYNTLLKEKYILSEQAYDGTKKNDRIESFVKNLNNEVKKFNQGKNKTKGKTLVYSQKVKKLSIIDQIKTILKADHKRLKYGYKTVPGNPILKKVAGLGAYFDTTVIKDLDQLKKEYFKLAKKYHPDAGGTTAQFQELGREYENLVKKLLSGSKLSEEQQKTEFEIDETLRKIIDQIITLEGIKIEVIGKWIWVSGNTYPVKDTLKSAGFVFIKKENVPYWVYKGVESASRGKMSIEEIRARYGTHTPDKSYKNKFISGIPKKINKTLLKTRLKKLMKLVNKRMI